MRGLVATLRVYLDPLVDEGVFCAGIDAGGVRVVERFLTRDTGGAAYGAPPTVPDPDPLTRVRQSASRFDVLVPAGLSADDQAMLERIVENAKPAHTAFALGSTSSCSSSGRPASASTPRSVPRPVFVPTVPGRADAVLATGYLGYSHPFDVPDRVVSDRDRIGALPAL